MHQNNIQKFKGTDYIIHEKEPDWKMNEELKIALYSDMPQDLSCEEKAMYIYVKSEVKIWNTNFQTEYLI